MIYTGKKNELLTCAKECKLTYHQYETNCIFDKEWIQVRLWVTFTKIILLKTFFFFFNNNSLLNPLWNKFLFYNHLFKVIFFFFFSNIEVVRHLKLTDL